MTVRPAKILLVIAPRTRVLYHLDGIEGAARVEKHY